MKLLYLTCNVEAILQQALEELTRRFSRSDMENMKVIEINENKVVHEISQDVTH